MHHPYIGNEQIFSHIPHFPVGPEGDKQRQEWAHGHPQRNKRSEQAIQVLFEADAAGIDRGQIMITKNFGGLSMRFDKTIPIGPTAGQPVLNHELIQKRHLTPQTKGCYGVPFMLGKRERE